MGVRVITRCRAFASAQTWFDRRRLYILLPALLVSWAATAAEPNITSLPKVAEGQSVGADIVRGWKLKRDGPYKPTPYGAAIAASPLPVRSGDKSLRLELHRGDCGKFPDGWNDCLYGNERVEFVASSADAIKVNSRGSYGWSVYLPADWNPKDLREIVLGQFHQSGRFNPAFQFFYQSQGGGLQVKSRVGVNQGNYGKEIRTIIPEKELRGKWHDIRVDAYWRRKADGYFRVTVDGTPAYDFKGRTIDGSEAFFKLGIYRLATELKSPDLIVYYDDIWKK